MKAIIASTSRIERNSAGETINLVVYRLTNGKAILRNLNQAKTDLESSGRLVGVNVDSIQTVSHPALVRALTKLKGGTVEGDFRFVKAGDKYVVTEVMRAITDPNHPDYGNVSVGDEVAYKVDQTIVDGFLELTPSYNQQVAEEEAFAKAQYAAELNGMFDSLGVSTSKASTQAIDDDAIPEEVLADMGIAADAAPAADAVPAEEGDTKKK